jgi:hypothetical protein
VFYYYLKTLGEFHLFGSGSDGGFREELANPAEAIG